MCFLKNVYNHKRMSSSLSFVFGIAGFLLSAFLYYGDKFSAYRGTFKFLHLFSPFGFDFKDIPNLQGKTFIVTGANSGLGFGIASLLAEAGADVIMACRSVKRGEDAKKLMGNTKGSLTVMEMDGSSLASTKRFADAFKALNRPLHGLFVNAGIMVPPFELTPDGIESQFQVNYLAQAGLTQELLPVFDKSQVTNIVFVSSVGHLHSVAEGVYTDLAKINDADQYQAMAWYGQSKLAQILYIKELDRCLGPDSMIRATVIHPGGVKGNLSRYYAGDAGLIKTLNDLLSQLICWDEKVAALTALGAAFLPQVVDGRARGKYFVPIAREQENIGFAKDQQLAKNVWDFTQRLLGEKGWASAKL